MPMHRRITSEEGIRMARARWDRFHATHEPEPKFERWHRYEYGIRDKSTGETHWRDLVSVRQASKALGLILKYY